MIHSAGFAKVVAGVVVFVAALELCTRIDDALSYGAPLLGRYSREVLFASDSLGRRGRPGARFQKWQLNSLGYRGPEIRPGTLRVICVGASETFGMDEAGGREYPRQLEEQLARRLGRDVVDVVNVSMPGQTLGTAMRRIPEIADQVHPSFAVVYAAVPTYIWLPWADGQLPGTAVPQTSAGVGGDFHLRITERLVNLVKGALPGALQGVWREVLIRQAIAKQHYPVMDRLPEENVRQFHQDLSRLVTVLVEHGIEPVLVTHATAVGEEPRATDREFVLTERRFYPMLKEEGFRDAERRLNEATRRVAAERHVTLVDAARTVPAGPKYFGDYSHFTTAGAEALAASVAGSLEALVARRLAR